MRIRKSFYSQRILLCADGAIAMRSDHCLPHLICRTQGLQHPDCVEIKISDPERQVIAYPTDPDVNSGVWKIDGSPGGFYLYGRWRSGHSPYPQIEKMSWSVFGGDFVEEDYPLASSDDGDVWKKIAYILINTDGEVYVDGQSRGIWPEFSSNSNNGDK